MASPRRLSMDQRAEIQASPESVRALAQRLGVNPKSVQRWRRRSSALERAPGRRKTSSSVLSGEEEALIIAFRQTTQLGLDDCLYALQPTIPHLRRSTLHRCLQRNGLSALASTSFATRHRTGRGGATKLGQIAIVISPAPTEEGLFYLFGATDRLTRFAYAQVYKSDQTDNAVAFVSALTAALPYRLDTLLTDDSPAFAWEAEHVAAQAAHSPHPFSAVCQAAGVRHIAAPRRIRILAPTHPHHFKYRSRQELQDRLTDFLIAVNYGQRLKALGGLTPFDRTSQLWRQEPNLFWRAPAKMGASDFQAPP